MAEKEPTAAAASERRAGTVESDEVTSQEGLRMPLGLPDAASPKTKDVFGTMRNETFSNFFHAFIPHIPFLKSSLVGVSFKSTHECGVD